MRLSCTKGRTKVYVDDVDITYCVAEVCTPRTGDPTEAPDFNASYDGPFVEVYLEEPPDRDEREDWPRVKVRGHVRLVSFIEGEEDWEFDV